MISDGWIRIGGEESSACRVRVTLYRSGRAEALERPEVARAVVEECEAEILRADGVLRLAVGEALIADLRRGETTIEVEYASTRTFRLPGLADREVLVERLMIPLTGDLARGVTTILVGRPQYLSGPFRAPARPGIGLERILDLAGHSPSEKDN